MNARVRTYSPREVATHFGLNLETVQRCLKRGELQGVRTGRRGHYWHIPEQALESWIASDACKRVLARSVGHWRYQGERQERYSPTRSAGPANPTGRRTESPPGPGTADPTEAIQGKPRQRKNKP